MWQKLSISTKIWFSIAILVIGHLISMVFGFYLGRQTETRLFHVSEYVFPATRQIQIALKSFKEQIKQYNDAVVLGEESFLESASLNAAEVDRALSQIIEIEGLESEKRREIKTLQNEMRDFVGSAENVYFALSTMLENDDLSLDGSDKAKISLKEKAFLLSKETDKLISKLSLQSRDFADELKLELSDISAVTRRQQYLNMVIFFVVVFTALSLISIIITRSISRPLKRTFMLEKAVEESIDGIAVFDMDGKLQFINKAWADMHGYALNELFGQNISLFYSESQLKCEAKPFYACVKEKGAHSGEVGHIRKDGTEFITMTTMNLLTDNNENTISLVEISRDITERKKGEEELRKAKESAEEANFALKESLEMLKRTQDHLVQSEKMVALGGLVAGVAHEINTPIGVGVTAASFLEMKTKSYYETYRNGKIKKSDFEKYINEANEASSIILKNLNTAADLIKSFKQVAVDQSGEKHRLINVKAYIGELLVSLRPKFKRTQHTITVNCPDDIELETYPGAISQIITNLAMNSLLHGFEGIEQGEIEINIKRENSGLLFHYHDNGVGMDESTVKQIFDPFFTTKRSHGGTGLGMHIVFNLVTQTLNGEIWCRSSLNAGTDFFIKIAMT